MNKRQYTREFKLSILQELETKSMVEVCREHNIACSTISGWKKVYDKNPVEAFKGHGKLYKEEAKIAEYERLIGRMSAKIDLLEKAYEAMKQQVADDQKKRKLRLK